MNSLLSLTPLYIDVHAFIESFVNTLEAKDAYTAGHSQRVSEYAVALAKQVGLSAAEVETIHIAAHLHDIGKIGVPDGILLKSGPLKPSEYLVIQDHPQLGADILAGVPGLDAVAAIVKHHHERFDGAGYPDRLEGYAIPLGARIVAIADAYDAMTSHRAYRRPLSCLEALAEIQSARARQFDPALTDAFCMVMSRMS